jgi:hypothetical protein
MSHKSQHPAGNRRMSTDRSRGPLWPRGDAPMHREPGNGHWRAECEGARRTLRWEPESANEPEEL